MSPDLVAEMARIQHTTRITQSLARTKHRVAEAEPVAAIRRGGSFPRRALAIAAIVVGLAIGAVGTLHAATSSGVAAQTSDPALMVNAKWTPVHPNNSRWVPASKGY